MTVTSTPPDAEIIASRAAFMAAVNDVRRSLESVFACWQRLRIADRRTGELAGVTFSAVVEEVLASRADGRPFVLPLPAKVRSK
jgi:hypothetical protein